MRTRTKILTTGAAVALGMVAGVILLSVAMKLNIFRLPYMDYAGYSAGQSNNYPSFRSKNVSYFSPTTSFIEAAKISTPAVVHVKTSTKGKVETYSNPFFYFDFPFKNYVPPQQGSGSGIIISENGYILTNNHVITNADKIMVTMSDKREFEANVIGTDGNTDLAILKVDASGLTYMKYGDSDLMEVGDWVLAVGNPFNLTSTVTAGIISAKGRNLQIIQSDFSIESFIQTDAAINPGNSGGALVNLNGELIGINTAIASGTGQYAGYGFAIPINLAKKVVDDVLKYGSVQRGFIGVQIQEVTADLAKQFNLDRVEGVQVKSVIENGAAEDAGIKVDDVILEVEGIKVNAVPELLEIIGKHRPGDKVMVKLNRKGKEMDVPIVLKNREGTTDIVTKSRSNEEEIKSFLGAGFEEISPSQKMKYNISAGIQVTSVKKGGKFYSQGIPEGFVITRMNNEPVKGLDDFFTRVSRAKGGILVEGYLPNGRKEYFAIGLE